MNRHMEDLPGVGLSYHAQLPSLQGWPGNPALVWPHPLTWGISRLHIVCTGNELKLSLPGSRRPPANQPKECDTCLDVNFLSLLISLHSDKLISCTIKCCEAGKCHKSQTRHNHVCDHPADH